MSGLPHVSLGSVLERWLILLGEGVAAPVVTMNDYSGNSISLVQSRIDFAQKKKVGRGGCSPSFVSVNLAVMNCQRNFFHSHNGISRTR